MGTGVPVSARVVEIANAYSEKHGDVVEQAGMVENAIAQSESFAGKDGRVSAAVIEAIRNRRCGCMIAARGIWAGAEVSASGGVGFVDGEVLPAELRSPLPGRTKASVPTWVG